MTHHIKEFKLEKAPATAYYIPNFVSDEEEQFLLSKVYSVPKPKWTQLSNRRLQNWGGIPHPKGMIVELIPQPHFDGPLFYPTITTLSLGSHTVLNFYLPKLEDDGNMSDIKEKLFSLLIEPRSLLILQDEMYCKYLHGIDEKTDDIISSSNVLNWNTCDISLRRCEEKGVNEDVDLFTPERTSCEDLSNVETKSSNEIEKERTLSEDCCVESVDADGSDLSCNEKIQLKQKMSFTSDEKSQHECIHKFQRSTRVSLTMRHVPKTSKVKIKLGR